MYILPSNGAIEGTNHHGDSLLTGEGIRARIASTYYAGSNVSLSANWTEVHGKGRPARGEMAVSVLL